MSIKLEVNINDFIKSDDTPICPGRLVFAWDDDKYSLIVGTYRGYKDKYDESTGECVQHLHIVDVLSWEKPTTDTFEHVKTYPMYHEPKVIVPDGTGRLVGVEDDSEYIVRLDTGIIGKYPEHLVKVFNWEKIEDAYKENDESTT